MVWHTVEGVSSIDQWIWEWHRFAKGRFREFVRVFCSGGERGVISHDEDMAALNALGRIGDSRAVDYLIHAVGSDALKHRHAAASALKVITGKDFGENQIR